MASGSMKSLTAAAFASFLLLTGCAKDVGPINLMHSAMPAASAPFIPDSGDDGSTVVALAFSGGGTRAAAFSYGVLTALDDLVVDEMPYRRSMVDNIRMISGTSGGAVLAAYFGLRGRDAYRDFDTRFLYRNAEESMHTNPLSPITLARAVSGGANDRSSFAYWLDENLYDNATFKGFRAPNTPQVWINASDIFNHSPFLFTYDTFAALCSDLDSVRISDAVAASAAAPVIFTPIVLEARRDSCDYKQPAWLTRALEKESGSIRLESYAHALSSYHHRQDINYVKLLDGGLTDNLGITGFALERAASATPHGPLSAEQAVKLRHLLFIVTDAGQFQTADWARQLHGPTVAPLVQTAIRTSMAASVLHELDALIMAMREWRSELVAFRCGLSQSAVKRMRGTLDGWNCRDVDVSVEHLSFADLDEPLATTLSAVPTRLTLPREQVDQLIAAGRKTVTGSQKIMTALRKIQHDADVRENLLVAAR